MPRTFSNAARAGGDDRRLLGLGVDRRHGGGPSDLSATLEGPSLPETMLELGGTLAGLVAIMLGIFMAVSLID